MNRRQFALSLLATTSAMAITETAFAQAPSPVPAAEYFTKALKGGQLLEETARTAYEKTGDPRIKTFARAEVVEQVKLADKLNVTTDRQGIEATRGPGLPGAPGTGGVVGAVAAVPLAVAGGAVRTTTGLFGLGGAPMTTDGQKAEMIQALKAMPAGPAFDARFVEVSLMGHREAFEIHDTYARVGGDPALRSIARGALPLIRLHITTLTRLQASMGRSQG